jgi:hypothetical protein
MTRAQEYERTLERLVSMLRRKPMTAKQIAQQMGCCIPVAHERIAALLERGAGVYMVPTDSKRTGPKATAYGVR